MNSHAHTNLAQYDSQGEAYLHSAIHAAGPDLAYACQQVAAQVPRPLRVLDVGCGAGHLSLAMARYADQVTALDPSTGMLDTVRAAATRQGLAQVSTTCAQAEHLPFGEATFDLVCSRYSAHHWLDLDAALTDMHRVLQPAGHIMLIDIAGHENALVDTHLQTMELLRDRSHVRNRSLSQWRDVLACHGFEILHHTTWATRIDFTSWVSRMRTAPDRVAMLRTLQAEAPQEVRQALQIEPDGSFTSETVLFWARPQAGCQD